VSEPSAELDLRFSEPDTSPTGWAEALRTIADAELFWVSTTRADGSPHVSPLVAVWVDGALHFCTGSTEQKARNLATNPKVALTTGVNGWQDGLDVVVEGAASRVTDRLELERLAEAWTQKWDGRWQYEVVDGGFRNGEHGLGYVYAVRPTKVLAFGKNPFTHTRYRFG
jgi:general stress protein 26